ncbi:hypothetical protein L917_10045, partial [Phytophthora nicotianae]
QSLSIGEYKADLLGLRGEFIETLSHGQTPTVAIIDLVAPLPSIPSYF